MNGSCAAFASGIKDGARCRLRPLPYRSHLFKSCIANRNKSLSRYDHQTVRIGPASVTIRQVNRSLRSILAVVAVTGRPLTRKEVV